MKKYNIALLPVSKIDDFMYLSKKIPLISDGYQLGGDSMPHVTLCQFYAEENELNDIWENICYSLTDQAIHLEFKRFSCLTFDDKIFWVSLLPDNVEYLNELHQKISKIIKSRAINYDPHLTLINTLDYDYKDKILDIIENYNYISDEFIISMGECDHLGQFIKIIEQYEN